MAEPLVGVIMGSRSDWDTMRHTAETLESLGVPFETRVLSAHRTPDELAEYAATAEDRGLEVLIAAAGGAAALPGAVAAKTTLPVLGVPMESKLSGLDSLLSMVQMPAGVPVGTLAVGKAGCGECRDPGDKHRGRRPSGISGAAPCSPRRAAGQSAQGTRPFGRVGGRRWPT